MRVNRRYLHRRGCAGTWKFHVKGMDLPIKEMVRSKEWEVYRFHGCPECHRTDHIPKWWIQTYDCECGKRGGPDWYRKIRTWAWRE